ncbi:MAG: septum formation initiator family protein [Gammaproteobacteria bacterium]|nr:septum formation initiator family protein [Gammaproteobacteria bacterium]
MRTVAAILLLLVLGLQYQSWFGDSGYFKATALKAQLEAEERRAELQRQRNRLLRGEVMALTGSDAAVEARARADLGMIKDGEVFYIVTDEPR